MTTAAGRVLIRVARVLRWPAAVWLLITWWSIYPPQTVGQMAFGIGALVAALRFTARSEVKQRRRATLRARCNLVVVVGILASPVVSPVSVMADVDPNVGYCRSAPSAETSGDGVTGMLDPQEHLPRDGTPYGDSGFAGLFWYAYDPGCVAEAGNVVLGQVGTAAFDGSGAGGQTAVGNILLKLAKLEVAGATGMRARALDPDQFNGFDKIFVTGVTALRDLAIEPWMGLPLLLLGIMLLVLANRGQSSETAKRTVTALVGLALIVFLGEYPLQLTAWMDSKLVALQRDFDRGFVDKLPAEMTPIIMSCIVPDKLADPRLEDGAVVIPGIPCTQSYRPSLNPSDNWTTRGGAVYRYQPDYFDKYYYPEMMVNHTIFRYWERGLLGTEDLSGPNYDLAKQFLNGQSQTQQEAEYEAKMQKVGTQEGAKLCQFQPGGGKECMTMGKGMQPPPMMSGNEEQYRVAVTKSIMSGQYPWVQGKAGNRISAGASALAAATAASPIQFAAYTGVFAGRILLRFFVFIGLLCSLGLLLGATKLLRRIWMTAGSALVTMAMLTVTGSLMTFLTLQAIGNKSLFGGTTGLVILALISILVWVIVRPMRRIAAMISTAATGDPGKLSNLRSGLTARGTGFLRRRSQLRMFRRFGKDYAPATDAAEPSTDAGPDDGRGAGGEVRRRPESRAAQDAAAAETSRVVRRAGSPHPTARRAGESGEGVSLLGARKTRSSYPPASASTNRGAGKSSSRPESPAGKRAPKSRVDLADRPALSSSEARMAGRNSDGVHVITSVPEANIYRPGGTPPVATPYRRADDALSERYRQLIWRPPARAALPSAPVEPEAKVRPEGAGPIVVEAAQ